MGPLFFILFINDLFDFVNTELQNVKPIIFADDTNAVIAADNLQELNSKVNEALSAFSIWFSINDLAVNIQKTNVMLFQSTSGNRDVVKCTLNNIDITAVKNVKFLGIFIDSLLNWKKELENVANSIGSACHVLRSLRDEITIEQLKMTYNALIDSRLRYSVKLWGNSYQYNINKAFVAQKRAIRIIFRLSQLESCRNYFIKLGVLTVPCLYIFVTLCDIIKHPSKLETPLEREVRLTTRRKDIPFKGNTDRPKLNIYRHSSRYQAARLYNRLPMELKTINKLSIFKRKLKSLLVRKCYYSVGDYLRDGPDK